MIRKKRVLYSEGDWFAMPLKDGRFAVGLIARKGKRGVLMGYFFGPRLDHIPAQVSALDFEPQDALCISIFGDLGILYGDWPIISASGEWDRAKWPVPDFGRIDTIDPTVGYRITYDGNDLPAVLREVRVGAHEARKLPEDGLFGWLAMEAYVQMKLS